MGPVGVMLRVGRKLALVDDGTGGVLVDLDGGAFFRVNQGGLRACVALLQAAPAHEREHEHEDEHDREVTDVEVNQDATGAIAELTARGVTAELARREVGAVLAALQSAPPPRLRAGALWLRPDAAGGWLLGSGGRACLRIDVAPGGGRVRPVEGVGQLDWAAALVWAAPHLLVLGGRAVLHASAVRLDERAFAWSGLSGAGKTTLARALVTAGAGLVAEDLVVLATPVAGQDGGVRVLVDGEARIRAWAIERAPTLAAGGEVDGASLLLAIEGVATVPLLRLGFVSAPTTRIARAQRFVETPMAVPEVVARLLENGFAELATRQVWWAVLDGAGRLAAEVTCSSVLVPDGLTGLAEAAEDWVFRLRAGR